MASLAASRIGSSVAAEALASGRSAFAAAAPASRAAAQALALPRRRGCGHAAGAGACPQCGRPAGYPAAATCALGSGPAGPVRSTSSRFPAAPAPAGEARGDATVAKAAISIAFHATSPPSERDRPARLGGSIAALMLILVMSGYVASTDIFLSAISLGYALVLGKYVVPPHADKPSSTQSPHQQLSDFKYPGFLAYARLFQIIGVVLPMVYAAAAFAIQDGTALRPACSYLYFLLTQILSEVVLGNTAKCSLPGFALLATIFNSCRLIRVCQWTLSLASFSTVGLTLGQTVWGYAGVTVAATLLQLWAYNLFGFLIPVLLPTAFRRYFKEESTAVKPSAAAGVPQALAPTNGAYKSAVPQSVPTNMLAWGASRN